MTVPTTGDAVAVSQVQIATCRALSRVYASRQPGQYRQRGSLQHVRKFNKGGLVLPLGVPYDADIDRLLFDCPKSSHLESVSFFAPANAVEAEQQSVYLQANNNSIAHEDLAKINNYLTKRHRARRTPLARRSEPSIIPGSCSQFICFTSKFNSQPINDVLWVNAVFQPKYKTSPGTVSFTGAYVTVGSNIIGYAPDSIMETTNSNNAVPTPNTVQYNAQGSYWSTNVDLPAQSQPIFLSAVAIQVPTPNTYASSSWQLCGTLNAPGEVDVQIPAAQYSACTNADASPQAVHTNTHAGIPTGRLASLVAGGTGGGGSNYGGSY